MSQELTDSLQDAMRAVLDRLYAAARAVAAYGNRHPRALEAANELAAALQGAAPPYAMQFVGDALFRDFRLVPVAYDGFLQCQQLGRALRGLGVREVRVERAPAAADLLPLLVCLGRALAGGGDPLELIKVPGLTWRDLPGAWWGEAGERVNAEVFAVGQVALAVDAADRLRAATPPCPWPETLAVVRRLERALDAHPAATRGALELAPGGWTPSRRAVSAAIHALATVRHLGATAPLGRAVAHAVLVLGLLGFTPRGGKPIAEAARAASRLFAAPVASRLGVEPHRLRVSVLIDRFLRYGDRADAWLAPMGLVDLLYALERARCPEDADFDFAWVDLLALAASDRRFDPDWVRVLVASSGVIPPGARVRLADGAEGVAMEPGASGDPRRPVVLVGGRLVVPDRPVTLLTAGAAH